MSGLTRRTALRGGAALAAFLPMASACAPSRTVAAGAGEAAFVDGVRMAELIAGGELSALEAVEAAIGRARAVEPELNAIVTETFEAARAEAIVGPEGMLAGVPSFTKDLVDRIGEPTLYGSRVFEGNIAPEDVPITAAWRKAGIISLGKTTTPEDGLISTTEPLLSGPTRNPWNTGHSTGGSSGGAAAVVAARVVPFAHASDGGGSIRIPASCCGLFGMKPSRRRLFTRRTGEPGAVELSVDHAVTLTVRDSEAVFRATQRLDGGYPALGRIGGPSERRLRIGFAPEPPAGTPLDPEVGAALERTARLCRRLGHKVVDYRVPFDGPRFADQFLLLWAAGAAQFAEAASAYSGQPVGPEIVEPWTLGLAGMFASREAELPGAIAYLEGFGAAYHAMFGEIDVLLTPTVARPADPIGYQDVTLDFDTLRERVVSFAAFTAPMNAAGAASMSVPLGWSEAGLPIGSMFSGRRGDEEMLFALAYELEQARPWIERLPPVRA